MTISEFNGYVDDVEEKNSSEWKAIRFCRWIIKELALRGVLFEEQLDPVADWVADYILEHEMLDAAGISEGRKLYEALAPVIPL